MRKPIRAGLALFLLPAAAALAGHGGSGGGSHGGSSRSSGSSHGSGSHVSGSHGGRGSSSGGHRGERSRGTFDHGSGDHHRHRGRGWIVFGGPFWNGWGWWGWDCPYFSECYGPPPVGPAYVVGEDGGGGGGGDYSDDVGSRDQGRPGEWGTIDTEIWPENALLFLDGRYVGTAGDFGGSDDYLYLRPGDYTLEFRLDGYESASLHLRVESGARIELNRKLHRISATPIDAPSDPPEPEGGLRRYWGKEGGKLVVLAGDEHRAVADDDDADDSVDDEDAGEAVPAPLSSMRSRAHYRSTTTASLRFFLEPADAAVYLDGHLIGVAADIARADGGTLVMPGSHTITVTRPGLRSRTLTVEVFAGESKRIELALEK